MIVVLILALMLVGCEAEKPPDLRDQFPLAFAFYVQRPNVQMTEWRGTYQLRSADMNQILKELCLPDRVIPGELINRTFSILEHHLKTVGPRCAE